MSIATLGASKNYADKKIQDTILNVVRGYPTMITTLDRANTAFGNNYNNMVDNQLYTIGVSSLSSINRPYLGFMGLVINSTHSPTGSSGKTQLVISSTGRMLYRIYWGATPTWSKWYEVTRNPDVYYVGGTSTYQSITALFQELASDTSEKIIYINPGTYDIYQEYRDAGIPTVPDEVISSDYLTRCVFVPPNTKVIGIGNVLLNWNPATTLEDPVNGITYGEARTWSPLNLRYACHIENIDIYTKYGRYCIHDDSHNAIEDQGVKHTFKNVRCVKDYISNGYGFNYTIGFGFSQKNIYEYDECYFKMASVDPVNAPAFYGHGVSGSLPATESPNITVKNSVILGGATNNQSIRLQSLNEGLLDIKTLFANCYIEGGISLDLYDLDTDAYAFDVTMLKSGNPTQTIDVPTDLTENPYPIKVYA